MLPLVLLVAVYGLLVAFDGYYIDVGWTVADAWKRMVDWSAAPGWMATGLAGGLVVLSLVLLALTVRAALRRQEDDGAPGSLDAAPAEPVAVGAPPR